MLGVQYGKMIYVFAIGETVTNLNIILENMWFQQYGTTSHFALKQWNYSVAVAKCDSRIISLNYDDNSPSKLCYLTQTIIFGVTYEVMSIKTILN